MEISIIVQNLKCNGCAKTIINKLSTLKNIANLQVNIDESSVSFQFLNDKDVEKVKAQLMALGYPSIDNANSFSSKAKSFISCATGKLAQ